MSFRHTLWQSHSAWVQACLRLPFNRQLAAGTLCRERFRQYLIQDAHFLVAYGQALAVTAAKAERPDALVQLTRAAHETMQVERELHQGLMPAFGVPPDQFADTPMGPACHHYSSYLLATAWSAPFPVALAALLPCFWIYAAVGRDTQRHSAPGNPYQAWIDTYAGGAFQAEVRRVRVLVHRVAASASSRTQAAMLAAYADAARLEWMFWDSAYAQRDWPAPGAV